jgi:ubiquinone/menaquinone biosynthesis C-methylase UbiE
MIAKELVVRCPACAHPLEVEAQLARCPSGHEWSRSGGYLDICPDEGPSVRRTFDGVWGAVYDRTVKNRWYSTFISPVWQGASRQIMRDMFALMEEAVDLPVGDSILDIPCGGGPVLSKAGDALQGRYVGMDLSPGQLGRAVKTARRRKLGDHVLLVRGDARRMPFEDEQFERICSFNGLHLIEDRLGVLREVARCLRPGGEVFGSTLVVSDKRASRLLHPWFFCLDLAPAQTRANFEEVLEGAGFTGLGIRQNGPIIVYRASRA